MKSFFKTFVASFIAISIVATLSLIITFSFIGSLINFSAPKKITPENAILEIDLSKILLSEQTQEPTASFSEIMNGGEVVTPLGILQTTQTINAAAVDPSVKLIFLKPDMVMGGIAQIEELRAALMNFRSCGKAVVSYIENPTNAGYYLASASDKIYMTVHDGGMSTFNGISTQMIFLKDALESLGVNVQLIRHGKYKSAGEMYIRNSSSPENLEQNQAMINSIWNSWGNAIAESRNIPFDTLNDIINNLELNSPDDFLKKGLVDELMTLEQLENKLAALSSQTEGSAAEKIAIQDYSQNLIPVKNEEAKIAVIYIDGEIIDGDMKLEVAGDRFAEVIADVRKDNTIKAAVLRVNSPGGSVLASEKIKAELDLLKERIPVIASYGDYAASGGYWISAGCDKIFANKTTLTGSIGVFSMIPDIKKTLNEKLHVNITSVNSNKHSDMYGMTRPLSKSEKEYLQASVEQIYDSFTGIVAEGRSMTKEEVDAIAQGRVWTGAEASGIGLVDEIGTLEDAINFAAGSVSQTYNITQVEIVECPKPLTGIELLLESMGLDINASVPKFLPFKNLENAFKNWDASQAGKVYARLPHEYIIK